jgi:hypothetical protein
MERREHGVRLRLEKVRRVIGVALDRRTIGVRR